LGRTPSGTGAARGNTCTTPTGKPGVCAYINDPACASIKSVMQARGISRQMDRYLRQAIRPPCGFDNVDYTMCCEGV